MTRVSCFHDIVLITVLGYFSCIMNLPQEKLALLKEYLLENGDDLTRLVSFFEEEIAKERTALNLARGIIDRHAYLEKEHYLLKLELILVHIKNINLSIV